MKKYIILFCLILMTISCEESHRSSTHTITRFDKEINDTLIPIKGGNYGAKFIYVKGFVDDSIYVSFGGNYYKSYFKNKIDTVIFADYYGQDKALFHFNPYKAKKGNLEITFKI